MDDGRSQTKHLMPRLKAICQTAAQGVAQTYLCSVVDHHSSSFGDKGWGCGYRNLQMLLSSLTHHTPYSERLGMTSGKGSGGVASISRLQVSTVCFLWCLWKIFVSSSFGDKGWGCGYCNLQMLFSSLTHHTPYSERLGMISGKGSGGVASISRLQVSTACFGWYLLKIFVT